MSVAWIGCAGIVDGAGANRNACGQRLRGRAQSGKDEGDGKQVFSGVGDDRAVSEYVSIGTLASVTWAIAASFLAVVLLAHLSPLGIPDSTP